MGGFFIRGRFLLICMLGQMGIFQGMHNSGETAAAINSARSVAGRIPQERNPSSSLPSVSRGKRRKPDIDVNMLINDLRRCPPKEKEKTLKKPKTEQMEVKEQEEEQIIIRGSLPQGYKAMSDDEKAVRMYLGEIGLTMDARQAQGIHNPDMNIIQDLTRSLFRKRAHELSGAAFIESEDVSDIRKKEERLLKSIARNLASLTPSKDKQVDDRRQNENELMMELLINLHKLQIIPNDRLTHFLNEENKGQVILSYAINRFSQHRQPEPPLALLIKDLRACLGRSPQRKEMRKILNLLKPETWKQIEALYLKARGGTK
ncbi:hypothetical protein PCASD_20734 [Puccinia coronata f. sp. avenae]|uniref:Uncharacterized protein n=1 Tax=Puccinia coronata f. sp. avenae TaxID=200324 RepID=A0A2N5SEP2_9BASI|nr:hypothetical protein PCASD_20734 [Puccinia coronata f. sp. avenae]